MSTDSKPDRVVDSTTPMPLYEPASVASFRTAMTTGLPVIVATAWVTLTVMTGDASPSPGKWMLPVLVAIAAVSAEIALADELELAQWGRALCLANGGCPMGLAALPPGARSAGAIGYGPNE